MPLGCSEFVPPRRRRGNDDSFSSFTIYESPAGWQGFMLPPGGVTFASSGGVQRSVQRERACAPSPFGNSLCGVGDYQIAPFAVLCTAKGRCGALRRENSIYSSLPVTAVEVETATVATGSVSEAVAESCGGTVLLTDSGTRERRLREEHEASLAQGLAR